MDAYDLFNKFVVLLGPNTLWPSSPSIEATSRYLHHFAKQVHSVVTPFLLNETISHLDDVLLLATGYRPSLDVSPFPVNLDDKGRFVQGPPNLYSIGFNYPTMEPFLVAVKREAAELTNQLLDKAASKRC